MDLIKYESQNGEMVVGGFRLTPTGLSAEGNPTFEEFDQLGQYLRRVHTGYQWWWGDWLNYGEGAYGERFSQALDATDWEESTLRQYAWVAKNVAPENRLDGVAFGHYVNGLASLEPAEQKLWAERIVAENLTQGQFVAKLKSETKKAVALWAVVSCIDLADQDALIERMVAEGRTTKIKVTHKKA